MVALVSTHFIGVDNNVSGAELNGFQAVIYTRILMMSEVLIMNDLEGWIDQLFHLEEQLKYWDVPRKYVRKARDIRVLLENQRE